MFSKVDEQRSLDRYSVNLIIFTDTNRSEVGTRWAPNFLGPDGVMNISTRPLADSAMKTHCIDFNRIVANSNTILKHKALDIWTANYKKSCPEKYQHHVSAKVDEQRSLDRYSVNFVSLLTQTEVRWGHDGPRNFWDLKGWWPNLYKGISWFSQGSCMNVCQFSHSVWKHIA